MNPNAPYRENGTTLHVRVAFVRFDWGHVRLMSPGLIVLGVIAYGLITGASWDRFGTAMASLFGGLSVALIAWVWSFRYRWLELERVGDALEIRQGLGRWVRRVRSVPLARIGVATPIWIEGAKGHRGPVLLHIVMTLQPFEQKAEELDLGAELNLPFERVRDIAREIHRLLGTPAIN